MIESAAAGQDEFFWNRLMRRIEGGQVVPVIGRDLLQVNDGHGVEPLARAVARRALAGLGVDPARPECERVASLDDAAVCWMRVAGREKLQDLYDAVDIVLQATRFPVPPILERLAGIEAFQLFVTTTWDPLLAQAVHAARGVRPQVVAYSPTEPSDIGRPIADLPAPVVYHLVGRAQPQGGFALTEEDTLEYIYALQTPTRQPKLLLDEISKRSLLIIGCGYSDWLARFFLRVTRPNQRLSAARPTRDILADTCVDASLQRFLEHFGVQTEVRTGAVEFVEELARRWGERRAALAAPAPARSPRELRTEVPEVPADSVFVSYAHEDFDDARRLVDALRLAKLEVWFDETNLEPGDRVEETILDGIERCTLFIPVVSRHVATNDPRFFFREWNHAIKRREWYGAGRTFLVPCRVDQTSPTAERIQREIRAAKIGDAFDDETRARFVKRVVETYRELGRARQLEAAER